MKKSSVITDHFKLSRFYTFLQIQPITGTIYLGIRMLCFLKLKFSHIFRMMNTCKSYGNVSINYGLYYIEQSASYWVTLTSVYCEIFSIYLQLYIQYKKMNIHSEIIYIMSSKASLLNIAYSKHHA